MSSTWKKLKKALLLRLSSSPTPPSSSSSATTAAAAAAVTATRPPSADVQAPSSSAADPPVPSRKTASFGSRLSRSFSLHSSSNSCAICLRSLKKGQGRAIFYAECSHPFHFTCIAESVKHGNHSCPICRSKWNNLPFQAPTPTILDDPRQRTVVPGRRRITPYNNNTTQALAEPVNFSDDEPHARVPSVDVASSSQPRMRTMTVQAFPEFPAVPARDSRSGFSVLVRVRAPSVDQTIGHGVPVDLVAVLDVSGSMITKLVLLKQAVRFVIQNLSPSDRISIITFSTHARRVLPLRRMSDGGREDAIRVVNSLEADGGTNIVAGLKKGVKVLEDRCDPNPIASIILLSDGRDTHSAAEANNKNRNAGDRVAEYQKLLPAAICQSNRAPGGNQGSELPTFPVHTFGFGLEHDSMIMNAISDASGGTFSFIESTDILQDAFARCIGGLLSVVAQDVRLSIESISSDVRIGSIPSGRYKAEIFDQGHQATITIGNLYAEEEKEFLVYISIPEETSQKTQLLDIVCFYRSSSTSAMLQVPRQRVEIGRPQVMSPADQVASLDVDRQRNRLSVAQTIAEAQRMAETGNLEAARKLLSDQKASLKSSPSARSGDGLSALLEAELDETESRMQNWRAYDQTGRAYVLSGLSSHSSQRATTRGQSRPLEPAGRDGQAGSSGTSITMTYETPSMSGMVSKSQIFQANAHRDQLPRKMYKSSSVVDRR